VQCIVWLQRRGRSECIRRFPPTAMKGKCMHAPWVKGGFVIFHLLCKVPCIDLIGWWGGFNLWASPDPILTWLWDQGLGGQGSV
jgi:hypothetical protein